MQKKLLSVPALLLTAVLVVGCNTSETKDSDAQKNEPSNTPTEQQQPSSKDTTVDESQETPTSNETNKDNTTKKEQEVKYVQKGVDKTEKATESKSADQDYKVHQLPGFTLTQEEPGKDMLVSNDNANVFMRIESIDASQTSYEDAKTSMQDYMNAVGDTSSLSSEDLAAFKDVKNIEGYVVHFEADKEKVIGVVFEKDGLITKLTIHDNDELDLTDAMLKMAATISKK
ncbi:chemotaxis protein [Lysinibacillus sp. CTST325]